MNAVYSAVDVRDIKHLDVGVRRAGSPVLFWRRRSARVNGRSYERFFKNIFSISFPFNMLLCCAIHVDIRII